jgi:hypothetical protein
MAIAISTPVPHGAHGTPQPNDRNDVSVLPDKLEGMIAAIITANPSLEREQAVHFLLHTARGRAAANHLANITKESPMPRFEKLHNVESVIAISKHIIDNGPSGVTEHEFTKMLADHAALNKRTEDSNAQAFSRVFTDPGNVEIRRAHALTKSFPNMMSVEPVSTEVGKTSVSDDSYKVAEQLKALVEEQRARAPTLTISELYDRVYADPANRTITARAHPRRSVHQAANSNSGENEGFIP